jgi:large subunit ribosomal protein L24
MKKNLKHNRPKPRKVRGKKLRFAKPVLAMKMKVKKGDTVKVISGKDKGKTGEVTLVMPKTGKIVVDGVAVAKRSLRSTAKGQSGRIVERSMPIDASNVMVTSKKTKTKTVKAEEKSEEKKDA